MRQKSREELVEMVQKLIDGTLPEGEEDELVGELKESVPHPRVTDLIYYSEPSLTAEQVVDAALAYRAIEL